MLLDVPPNNFLLLKINALYLRILYCSSVNATFTNLFSCFE